MKTLCSTYGSPITFHSASHTEVLAARLREHLECNVKIEKAPISGDHDWLCLAIPVKHHAAARAYVDGWSQGRLDGIDLYQGRQIPLTKAERDADYAESEARYQKFLAEQSAAHTKETSP